MEQLNKPSITKLKKIQHKPNRRECLYVRILRKISIHITWALLHTNITANQLSVISILVGATASYFFISKKPIYWIAGYLILQIHLILDVCDGEIARYRKQTSKLGSYIDDLNHAIVNPLIFIAMAFGFYKIFNDISIFLIGFSAVFGILLLRVHNTTVISMRGLDNVKKDRQKKGRQGPIKILYSFFFREFGGMMHLLLLATILDSLLVFLNIDAVIYNLALSFRFLYFILGGIFFPLVFVIRLYNFSKTRK